MKAGKSSAFLVKRCVVFHKRCIVCVNRNCVEALGVWVFLTTPETVSVYINFVAFDFVGYLNIWYSAIGSLSPKTNGWFADQHGETTRTQTGDFGSKSVLLKLKKLRNHYMEGCFFLHFGGVWG